MNGTFYGDDLAFVHHHGFGGFAEAAVPGLLHILDGTTRRAGLVVDLGCGSGIWARSALAAGYGVLGIDISPAMVALAREQAPAATFLVGSLHSAPLPSCVAITAIGEAMSYLEPGSEDVDPMPLFARAFQALAPDGVFVFDVVERGGEPMHYRSSRTGYDWEVEVDVAEDVSSGIITRRIRTTRVASGARNRSEETHRVQAFHRGTIERSLRAVGFDVDFVTGYGAAALPARRVGVIARKSPTRDTAAIAAATTLP